MAATIAERIESRSITENSSAELIYNVRGTSDETEVISLLNSTSPTSYLGLSRQESSIEPVHVDTLTPSACIWTATARYAKNSNSGTADDHPTQYAFDTSGGTEHVMQSRGTTEIKAVVTDGIADDLNGMINVSGNSVNGIDIPVPVYTWSETHFIDVSALTGSYRGILFKLTGTVNSNYFKGHDPGECLFMGATASWDADADGAMVTYRFASSPNVSKLSVAGKEVEKKGWQYVWVRYKNGGDSQSSPCPEPKTIYVETLYREADFTHLGIGV